MRKVRTALDTAIRTKNVRSFSGKSGWSGISNRGHPGGSAAGSSEIRAGQRRNAAATAYRKEAIEKLSPSQRRAFEKLPVRTQEELLIRTEKRIDRRISAGRYRGAGTTATVAAGSAKIRKGKLESLDPGIFSFPAGMGSFGLSGDPFYAGQSVLRAKGNDRQDGRNETDGHAENEPYMRRYGGAPDDGYDVALNRDALFSPAGRRRKHARRQVLKDKEKHLQAKREAAKKGIAGSAPAKELSHESFTDPAAAASEALSSGTISRSRKHTPETGSGASEKTGKLISRDYAKVLGRLIETQIRFTRQLENGKSDVQRQKTIQELKEKETKRAYRIVSFSLSKAKAAFGDLTKAAKFLASKGKGYLVLLLVPIMLLVMMVPLLLSSISLTEDEATASITATQLVEYALSWVGVTQYIWGEGRAYETDWQDYTDCSGFVHGVFSHFGYEIGGDTVSMEGSGTLVEENSLDKALPGDIILFFSGGIAPGNSTHVGIYIGNGQMVHCSGGRANVSPETAGPGVMVTMVAYDSRAYQIRQIIEEGAYAGIGTCGHRVDPTNYSTSDLQLIWAIVAQEDNGSYEGALAVISSAMNRTESPVWGYLGNTAMQQLCAPGQYCYSNDHYWEARLGGNVPEYVKQAVNDCLKKGIRNHSFTCFRSTKGSQTGPNAVQIGGNWFFGN